MGTTSVAEYCRAVEAHLTQVNGGHLVRIVGPGFVLVREWEATGIPLSVVQRAIDQKAERHSRGAGSRRGRPLHIEFCEDDVRELFEDWKRAVGVSAAPSHQEEPSQPAPSHGAPAPAHLAPPHRAPSLSKHLERVSDRLSRLLGRQDLPEPFLDRVNMTISAVAAARERARTARGAARDEIIAAIRPLDDELVTAAELALDAVELNALQKQADGELAAFRNRLSGEAWEKAQRATMARLLRERFGLPVIDPDEV